MTKPKPDSNRVKGAARTRLRNKAVSLYEGGKSIREIGVILGRSYGGVQTLLDEAGVQRRPSHNKKASES